MLRHHLRRCFATFVAVGVFVGTAATTPPWPLARSSPPPPHRPQPER